MVQLGNLTGASQPSVQVTDFRGASFIAEVLAAACSLARPICLVTICNTGCGHGIDLLQSMVAQLTLDSLGTAVGLALQSALDLVSLSCLSLAGALGRIDLGCVDAFSHSLLVSACYTDIASNSDSCSLTVFCEDNNSIAVGMTQLVDFAAVFGIISHPVGQICDLDGASFIAKVLAAAFGLAGPVCLVTVCNTGCFLGIGLLQSMVAQLALDSLGAAVGLAFQSALDLVNLSCFSLAGAFGGIDFRCVDIFNHSFLVSACHTDIASNSDSCSLTVFCEDNKSITVGVTQLVDLALASLPSVQIGNFVLTVFINEVLGALGILALVVVMPACIGAGRRLTGN